MRGTEAAWAAATRRVSSRFSVTMRRRAAGAPAWEASQSSSRPVAASASAPSWPTAASGHSPDSRFSAMWKVREDQMPSTICG